jgi:hypothetical protein
MMTLSLVSLPATVAAEADDITGHKYETVMRKWIAKGWMAGTGAPGVFEPDKGVTRADFAVFFNHFANLTEESPDIGKYPDVTGWQVLHMSRALQAGYYKGDGAKLMPGEPIPQEQALTSLKSQGRFPDAADLSALDSLSNADKVSDWARPFVAAAMEANFAMVADGELLAQDGLTRAETVFLLDSILTDTRTYGIPGATVTGSHGGAVLAADGVTLKYCDIAGDVCIDGAVAEGDVYIDNVTIGGTLIIQGGGLERVHIKAGKISGVAVTKEGVRVVLEGGTDVTQMQVNGKGALVVIESGAKITHLYVGAAAEISGGGSVVNATVTANGVDIAFQPTGVVRVEGENVTASIGGKTVHSSGPAVTPTPAPPPTPSVPPTHTPPPTDNPNPGTYPASASIIAVMNEAVSNAEALMRSTMTSSDGTDVAIGMYWVTPDVMNAFVLAIMTARAIPLTSTQSTDIANAIVVGARQELLAAHAVFSLARMPGTKVEDIP